MFKRYKEKIVSISGMSCNHCKMKVTSALEKINNVKKVKVSLEEGKADIKYVDYLNDEIIKNVIEDLGYKVGGII